MEEVREERAGKGAELGGGGGGRRGGEVRVGVGRASARAVPELCPRRGQWRGWERPRAGGGRKAWEGLEPAGSVPRRGFLVKQSTVCRQDCLCRYLLTLPWPGARSGGGEARPAPLPLAGALSGPGHQSGALSSRMQPAHKQPRTPGQLAREGRGLRASARPLSWELLQLVKVDEIFCPKLIIIMNLHFFPQENN